MILDCRTGRRKSVVVIGNGMVGHRFCQRLVACDAARAYAITTFCEEPRPAYNRVNLTEYFQHRDAGRLLLADPDWYRENGISLHLGECATAIDRGRRLVRSNHGREVHYDVVILASGSAPFVPPIVGVEKKGVFVYRTVEDLDGILTYAERAKTAAIIGGGLVGLEAAKAVSDLGLQTHIIEANTRLMPLQLDDVGSRLLASKIEALGIQVHTGKASEAVCGNGAVTGITFADGQTIDVDMIVVAAGIRPRDELARECGLQVGDRGGVIVDDLLRTSDPAIFAVGEVALHRKRIHGLVAPGYEMADIVANHLTGTTRHFCCTRTATRLKVPGVVAASFGNCAAGPQDAKSVIYEDPFEGVYHRLVVSHDGTRLLGGVLVGDTSGYDRLLGLFQRDAPLSVPPRSLLFGDREASSAEAMQDMPDDMRVCSCNNVTKGDICRAIDTKGLFDIFGIKTATNAGTCCGGCLPVVQKILDDQLEVAGRKVVRGLCEHFAVTRQELFQIVKTKRITTFEELLSSHGKGNGCEICKPAVASILASLWNQNVLEHAALQDTNDRFLANVQKGGLYSVVPRIPGGEITPDKLLTLAGIAKKYGLSTKITGGQRIDMFGVPCHKLPDIWEELVDAGFESGHAYGKAVRTVKSCVGTNWCRFAVGDSAGMAVRLELRYRGIRAPHKIKAAVSGCVRECAEAHSKDFGLIATENGWNLFVCGNGGAQPRHADLLAADLDEDMCIRYIDRFLMYYIQTADHLTRTSKWLENMEGGIEYLRDVVINDRLRIADELERQVQFLVGSYKCEWREVVKDPVKRRLFRQFVNTDEAEASMGFIVERGQARPAGWPSDLALLRRPKMSQSAVPQEVRPTPSPRWVAVGKVHSFPKDAGVCVKVEDLQIAVYNFASRGEWYACDNTCPHKREAVLSHGILGDQNGTPKIACPIHKQTFSLKSGDCLSGDELSVNIFAVKIEGDEVYLELPASRNCCNKRQAGKRECNCGTSQHGVRPAEATVTPASTT